MPFDHETVCHGAREYVGDMPHIDGIESFWSMLKGGCQGTCHDMSARHPGRYITEFPGRHDDGERDIVDTMRNVAQRMVGKRLMY